MDNKTISEKKYILIFLILVLGILNTNSLLAQNVSFSADSVIYDGKYPKAIVTQDFNNDSSQDLAELVWDNTNGNHIAIFFNDGNGIFNTNPDSIYSVGDFPVDLKSDDFNNDGYQDLVTSLHNDSSIVIWYGVGDGTFNGYDSIRLPIRCDYLAISDFNNDNNKDIAISDNGHMACMLGNGDGTFQQPTLYNSTNSSWDIKSYDMNNDNYDDILIGNGSSNYFYIFYNDSSAGFSNRVAVVTNRPPWFLNVCYFNSDAYPDIVIGSGSYESENVFAIVNDTYGSFVSADTASPCGYVRDIEAGDLNSDGYQDALVVDDHGIYSVIGDGAGKFGTIDTIAFDQGNFNAKVIHISDINGDDKADLIIGRVNQISIYYNTGTINSINEKVNAAKSFELFQNYPNPFNPNTTITYQLKNPSNVELNVYNLLGQKIATLVSVHQLAGSYKFEWNADHLSSSVYFYRLKTTNGVQIKKMHLLK